MRIVSGLYRGRKIVAPKGVLVRPTTDKVRGAIFNMLQSRGLVEGANVLDCFCGTGGMGLEALSRGAAFCTFVDSARESLFCTRENISSLGVEGQARVLAADVLKIPHRTDDTPPADMAFFDPPYEKGLLVPALEKVLKGGWLAGDAYVVCEVEKRFSDGLPPSFSILDDRAYGEVRLFLLQLTTPV